MKHVEAQETFVGHFQFLAERFLVAEKQRFNVTERCKSSLSDSHYILVTLM